jgi:hypothetical protein
MAPVSSPQPRLFYDSLEDAMREVIAACDGPKAVGAILWPAKSADAARTRLLDCLNHERPEKLAPEEILMLARLGRDRACHAIIEFICMDTGYAPPSPRGLVLKPRPLLLPQLSP